MITYFSFNPELLKSVSDEIPQDEAMSVRKNELIYLYSIKPYFFYFAPLTAQIFMVDFSRMITERELAATLFYVPSDMSMTPILEGTDPFRSKKPVRFLLGKSCPMACPYCYAGGGTGKEPEWPYVKAVLDRKLSETKEDVTVAFHGGGEPLLEIDLIKDIVEYLESHGVSPGLHVQTGGYVDEDTIRWLIEKGAKVGVSFDGPPSIQDEQRPLKGGGKTSEVVERNIRTLAEAGALDIVLSVITEHSVDRVEQIVHHVHSLGARKLGLMRMDAQRAAGTNFGPPSLERFLSSYLQAAETADELGMALTVNRGMFNFAAPRRRACRVDLGVTPDGKLTACAEHFDADHASDTFTYGAYDPEEGKMTLQPKVYKRHLMRTFERLGCSGCILRYNCAGKCPLQAMDSEGDLMSVHAPDECETFRRYGQQYLQYKCERELRAIRPYILEENGVTYICTFGGVRKVSFCKSLEDMGRDEEALHLKVRFSSMSFEEIDSFFEGINTLYHPDSDQFPWILVEPLMEETPTMEDLYKLAYAVERGLRGPLVIRYTKPPEALLSGFPEKARFINALGKGCLNCLNLFRVYDDGTVLFCNGVRASSPLASYITRFDLHNEFMNSAGGGAVPECPFFEGNHKGRG